MPTLNNGQINLVRLMGELRPLVDQPVGEIDKNILLSKLYEIKSLLAQPDCTEVPTEAFEAVGPTARHDCLDIVVTALLTAVSNGE